MQSNMVSYNLLISVRKTCICSKLFPPFFSPHFIFLGGINSTGYFRYWGRLIQKKPQECYIADWLCLVWDELWVWQHCADIVNTTKYFKRVHKPEVVLLLHSHPSVKCGSQRTNWDRFCILFGVDEIFCVMAFPVNLGKQHRLLFCTKTSARTQMKLA